MLRKPDGKGYIDPNSNTELQKIFEKIKEKNDLESNFEELTQSATWRFAKKIKNMISSLKKSKGGRQLQQKIDNFKGSTYDLKLSYTCRKRKAQEELVFEKEKCQKLERELEIVKKENENLNKLNQYYARKLVKKACGHVNLKGSKAGKNLHKYSRAQQYRIRKARVTNCKSALGFLNDEYTPLCIKVKNSKGEYEDIVLQKDPSEEKANTEKQNLHSVLYIKDRFGISHAAYHELAMVCKKLPRRHWLQSSINQLNSCYQINPVPGDLIGFQQSIGHLLDIVLKRHAAEKFPIPDKIRIKLSGDGTWLGKRIHVVNFTFTLPDFPDAASAHGNNLIAIFRGSESYDQIKKSLRDILQEAKVLQTFPFLGRTLSLEFFLGGDLKFLNMISGIDSCSSKFSCLWCKCPSEERYNTALAWSMMDRMQGARTVQEITSMAAIKSKANKFNCSNPPLFNFIPITRVVPDSLHLFLRISDQLIHQLIRDIKQLDNITNSTKLDKITDDRMARVCSFQNFIKDLGLHDFKFYIDKDTKRLKYRDFTGPEKQKILSNIKISDFICPKARAQKLQKLWDQFLVLMTQMRNLTHNDLVALNSFQVSAKEWVTAYVKLHQSKDATPYMHILMYHVCESVKLNGQIGHFTMQGLEKLNDKVSKWFYRSSSFSLKNALKQVMQKHNRLATLKSLKSRRELKFQWKCTKCNSTGHSAKTCKAA